MPAPLSFYRGLGSGTGVWVGIAVFFAAYFLPNSNSNLAVVFLSGLGLALFSERLTRRLNLNKQNEFVKGIFRGYALGVFAVLLGAVAYDLLTGQPI